MTFSNYALGRAMPALPPESVIMGLFEQGFGDVERLQQVFPDIYTEWHYRHWSGGGLMPFEPGYDAAADDNLPAAVELT